MKKAPNILVTTFSFFEKKRKKKGPITPRGKKGYRSQPHIRVHPTFYQIPLTPMQGRNRTYNSKFRSKTFSTLRLEYGVQMNDKSF